MEQNNSNKDRFLWFIIGLCSGIFSAFVTVVLIIFCIRVFVINPLFKSNDYYSYNYEPEIIPIPMPYYGGAELKNMPYTGNGWVIK